MRISLIPSKRVSISTAVFVTSLTFSPAMENPNGDNYIGMPIAGAVISHAPEVIVDMIPKAELLDYVWDGGLYSLAALAVAAAEGTMTYTGERTWAYESHTDPGNGVTNQGRFSYQHKASDAKDADEKQLKRLIRQSQQLHNYAAQKGLALSVEEIINAIDLANQAPLAALGEWGFIDRLIQAKSEKGLEGDAAILEARVWSYWSPDKQHWDAPGLGNNEPAIRADQKRRMYEINRSLQFNLEQRKVSKSKY